ncbi:MAG: aminoglycoside phosphotransferase family protein, partial [Panacibacter sp.]
YENILQNPEFKKRVTHHDTKISNVLFDSDNKGLCVIDLDTVMPGHFISDVGDMMRTYLSPAGEEESDLSAIEVREAYFEAIVNGYLSEMQDELTTTEKDYFIYAGKFMIYMQALRFMADYLNNDIYYGAKYELHNLNRAINQLTLLNRLVEKESLLLEITRSCLLRNNIQKSTSE